MLLILSLFFASTYASTEACVSANRRVCYDDVNWNAQGFSLSHDLREGCCTTKVGYAGAGATYHDEMSCKDLGFTNPGQRTRASLSVPSYSQRMCSLSGVDCEEHPEYTDCVDINSVAMDALKGMAKGLGLRASCGGMEVFTSCQQLLNIYTRSRPSYHEYEVVRGETSCEAQGMDLITDLAECKRASIFLQKGSEVYEAAPRVKGHYKVPRGCILNKPMQSYADASGNLKTYSPKNELDKADGHGTKAIYFVKPQNYFWKDDAHGTDNCNTFPCICRRGREAECAASSPFAGTDGKCGWNNGKKKCSVYVNPRFKWCSSGGYCGETPEFYGNFHGNDAHFYRRFDDAAIPELCRPEGKDGCGMYNINRAQGCGWDGADKAGRRYEAGMDNANECNQACKRLGPGCKYAAYKQGSGVGYCHMFKTCTGNEGSNWNTYEKRCSHTAETNALAEQWLEEGKWTQGDIATFGFAGVGLVAVLYGAAKFYCAPTNGFKPLH